MPKADEKARRIGYTKLFYPLRFLVMHDVTKLKNALFVLLFALGFFSNSTTSSLAGETHCCLPFEAVRFTVLSGTTSFLEAVFNELPPGFVISNGIYLAWCVDYDTEITAGPMFHGKLYDSYSTNLPPAIQNDPWDKVNYLLNHKQGSAGDVQSAMWCLLGQTNAPSCANASRAMLDEANQNGTGFVPTNGQLRGILIAPEEPVQRVICETVCTASASAANQPTNTVIKSTMFSTNGHFKFSISGPAGRCLLLEGSTNLLNWTPITILPNNNGSVEFSDTNAANFSLRFYRAFQQ